MFNHAKMHTMYKIANAPVLEFPYPHLVLDHVFPEDFYNCLMANLPSLEEMFPIAEKRSVRGFNERFVLPLDDASIKTIDIHKQTFWKTLNAVYLSGGFKELLLLKFKTHIEQRFNDIESIDFKDEFLLINDVTNYTLGPHTDTPRKVLSLLFYLPQSEADLKLGTSIYIPKLVNFECEGQQHHPVDHFNKITTVPFKSNSLFCFPKSNSSFHGVEKIETPEVRRSLLLYDIYIDAKKTVASPEKKVTLFSF